MYVISPTRLSKKPRTSRYAFQRVYSFVKCPGSCRFQILYRSLHRRPHLFTYKVATVQQLTSDEKTHRRDFVTDILSRIDIELGSFQESCFLMKLLYTSLQKSVGKAQAYGALKILTAPGIFPRYL